MRLHQLVVENINSLRGTHTVDFDRLFAASDLLLIAGETGAGKSTLFDAIHIALYGRTPRLSQTATSKNEEQSVQHVMTRGAGSCDVTLVFSVLSQYGDRERYRAHWHLHKARNRADGRVQAPTETLAYYDATEDAWVNMLEDGRFNSFQEARDYVLHGLTEEDFVRTVLLPQGQFDALLSADEKARATALRRVVDVNEIEAIGKRAAQRRTDAKDAYEKESARYGAKAEALMTDEARTQLQEALREIEAHSHTLAHQEQELTTRIHWHKEGKRLQHDALHAQAQMVDAQHAQQACADDRATLQEHLRVAPIMTMIRTMEEANKTFVVHQNDEEARARTMNECEAIVSPLVERRNAAAQALAEHAAFEENQMPLLQKARELWVQRRTHKHTVEWTNREVENQTQQRESARETLQIQEDKKKTIEDTLTELRAAQREAGLSTETRGLAPSVQTLLETGREHVLAYRTQHQHHTEIEATWTSLQHAWKEAETRATTRDQEATAWRQAAQAFGHRLTQTLSLPIDSTTIRYDTLATWEDALLEERDAVDEYGKAYGAFCDEAKKYHDLRTERDAVQEAYDTSTMRQREHNTKLQESQRACEEKERAYQDAVGRLALHTQYLDLVDELMQNNRCPVCGTENPAHQAEHAEHLRAEKVRMETICAQREEEKNHALAQRERYQQEGESLREKQIAAETRLKEVQQRLRQADDARTASYQILKDQQRYQQVPFDADLEPLHDALEALRNRAKTIRTLHAQCKNVDADGRALQNRFSKEEAADNALKQRREEVEQKREKTNAALTEQREKLTRWVREASSLLQQAELVRWQPKKTDDLVQDASASIDALQNVLHAITTANDLAKDYARALSQHETVVHDLKQAQQRAGERQQAYEGAVQKSAEAVRVYAASKEQCDALFDGQSPEAVQDAWIQQRKQKQAARDETQKRVDEAQRKLQDAQSQWAAARTLRMESEKNLEAQRAAVASGMHDLGITDLEDLKKRSLPSDVQRRIEEQLQQVDDAVKQRTSVYETLHNQLLAHKERGAALGDYTDDDEIQLAAIQQHITESQQKRGSIQTDLRRDEEARIALEKAGERLTGLKADYEEWEQLHQLVGVNKGTKFVEFALALSLRELIAHANVQLKTICPRYQLRQRTDAAGVPVIDFEIVDRDFSYDIRPLANLSGGERFQLSLAMALGLSSMSKRILPIETLLIDEGFGTLDPETLDKAIQTLHGLYQRTGAKVVLISHVERLRETLPTKIIVRKRGGGHSSLEIHDGLSNVLG